MRRLAEIRKNQGLSQADLGKIVNAAQNSVSNWENGAREPSNEDLIKLANFFGVSTDYLLGRTDDPTHTNRKSPDIEPDLDINTLEYALYGEARDLDDDEKQQLLELAKLMRKKRQEAEGKK